MRFSTHAALLAAALVACAASLPVERRDYILSRPHGWVEVTIADGGVPAAAVTLESLYEALTGKPRPAEQGR